MKKAALLVVPLFLLGAAFAAPAAHAQLDPSAGTLPAGTNGLVDPSTGTLSPSAPQTSAGLPSPNSTALKNYSDTFVNLINDYVVPVIIALAFIVFLWGVYNYFIYGADDEEKRKTGRIFVMYGLIGFVLIFALWGVVNLVGDALNLTGGHAPPTPQL